MMGRYALQIYNILFGISVVKWLSNKLKYSKASFSEDTSQTLLTTNLKYLQ